MRQHLPSGNEAQPQLMIRGSKWRFRAALFDGTLNTRNRRALRQFSISQNKSSCLTELSRGFLEVTVSNLRIPRPDDFKAPFFPDVAKIN